MRRAAHLTLILNIATAKTVRTFLIAQTIAITTSSFFLLPSSFCYKIENSVTVLKIIIGALIGSLIATHKFRRRPIVTPGPPHATALAVVKFLPLAAVELGVYWRSAINPDLSGIRTASAALGTAKLISVNRRRSPFRRMWSKSFHVLEFLSKLLVITANQGLRKIRRLGNDLSNDISTLLSA